MATAALPFIAKGSAAVSYLLRRSDRGGTAAAYMPREHCRRDDDDSGTSLKGSAAVDLTPTVRATAALPFITREVPLSPSSARQ